MATMYIKFKFLGETTQTNKVLKREFPPQIKPQNAREYRYFDLENYTREHLANEVEEKDMIDPTKWESCLN